MHVQVAEGPEPWQVEIVQLLVEQMELGGGLKTSQVACTLVDAWWDECGRWWTMTDVANFSTKPIWLAVGTLLAEAEQVEEEWICLIVEPGVDRLENMADAPYHNTLSWEPVVVAMDKDIADMVS